MRIGKSRGDARELTGLRILVTGASGTFGRALSQELQARGAVVVGLDLRPADGPVPVIACDITDDASVTAGVAAALERLGGLDVLVNNAGIGGPAAAAAPPNEEVRRQLEINLLGAWRTTAAGSPSATGSGPRTRPSTPSWPTSPSRGGTGSSAGWCCPTSSPA